MLGYVGGEEGHTVADPIYDIPLAVLAVVLSALIGYETFRYAEQRREIRGATHEH